VSPPGEGYPYHYSDTGYVVLGLILEHLDGQPLHDLYRRRILDPLEMRETYLEGCEPHRGPPLTHAAEGPFDVMAIHGSADWAGGGLVSTTADLDRFLRGLFGGMLLPPDSLDTMARYDFRTLDPSRHSAGFLGYGMGLEARQVRGRLLRGHRGHWGVLCHCDPATMTTITGTINQAQVRPDALLDGALGCLQGRRWLLTSVQDSETGEDRWT